MHACVLLCNWVRVLLDQYNHESIFLYIYSFLTACVGVRQTLKMLLDHFVNATALERGRALLLLQVT